MATLISVSEYLRTSYRPDCEYVDGEVLERHVGEQGHAILSAFLTATFWRNRESWQLRALPAQRVRVSAERFRVPDVCVVPRSAPNEEVLHTAPLLCIEVLAREDTFLRLQQRVQDFVAMGVATLWMVDPWSRLAYYASAQGYLQPTDGTLRLPGTEAAISLEEMFRELEIA